LKYLFAAEPVPRLLMMPMPALATTTIEQMLAQAQANALPPIVILVLCIVAGVGTVMLLPGRRETAYRKIGGVILLAAMLVFVAMLVRQTAARTSGDVYFWIFSAIAVVSALRVITHVKPVYSALYFVLTVVASAGLFVLLWAEFMAAALILIYAGAILVTYVFVIMLASQAQSGGTTEGEGAADYDRFSREPVWATAIGFALMGVLLFLIFDKGQGLVAPAAAAVANEKVPAAEVSVRALGEYLFTTQVLTLELAGLLLTISMVGAVIIARRRVEEVPASVTGPSGQTITTPGTPTGPDDNPHSIPIYGTTNPQAKAYPER
jgi:NADH-quinone oxidoreductase subunit J